MRTIRRSSRFKKDFKREARAGHGQVFLDTLTITIQQLAEDSSLPERLFDHALTGDWSGYRDCHIRPDIVLIYQKPDEETLDLVRLGSHSELDL
jgi:mRNA interferase YafQ